MTKTECYMWLVNDLLLTAAELLYDAFILLVAAAALGVWLSTSGCFLQRPGRLSSAFCWAL
ncbi:hypothetical protein LUB13_07630 [Lactobacillus delbrueckii subsp. lactis]|uniref:hypothetical protein n=1 Tax=Lactobacillus delbrueckii TaxID=1584 RepID=UPI001E494735|nr:hypothetical protein [Lactobacillus delbrueckii]MCD9219263.1 hypothetical protein [Lactobacillus delbrueckii subsp. lactis]